MYSVTTQTFPVDPQAPDSQVIAQAAERLRADGLVAFPTETVYGLGANALSQLAVGRIFEVKRRPAYDPLIVHLASVAQIEQVAQDVPPLAYELAARYWPGPLTLVLRRQPVVASHVSAGTDTVAVRMPDHRVPLALIERSGLPIAAPSANLFTRPSPTSAQHVLEDLAGHVDLVLDGGPCSIGLESTVLDLTGPRPIVLRPGGLPVERLKRYIPDLELARRYAEGEESGPLSGPGMLAKHYSPKARLLLFTGSSPAARERLREAAVLLSSQGFKLGILVTAEDVVHFRGLDMPMAELGSEQDLPEIGRRLFAQMRALDAQGVDAILVRAVSQAGLGLTIWDRLYRAAEGQVYDAEGLLDLEALAAAVRRGAAA